MFAHCVSRCARSLLQYGAAITGRTLDENDTPLQVAAGNGLPEHAELYLRYGAAVDKRNDEGLTPLLAACARPQEAQELERYFRVCRTLLAAGADVHAVDRDKHTPLHMACRNANADVVDLLLANGARVNDMEYGGEAPMHNILKVACYKVSQQPERIVRALLNHGSIRVWPGALPTVGHRQACVHWFEADFRGGGASANVVQPPQIIWHYWLSCCCDVIN
ncbi:Ankyrin repeat and SOCS box protein 10 [Liparis tanakae]|uniref:Ankyrin repeat and SOCS box protein 10 n=1 Tax=Liparis tanakae TaxID=230148 RepID=A0A4Z2E0Z0_9TELE|nr:Ankyrin repeat and SOCS box protein 10 [Liparis tanakae]